MSHQWPLKGYKPNEKVASHEPSLKWGWKDQRACNPQHWTSLVFVFPMSFIDIVHNFPVFRGIFQKTWTDLLLFLWLLLLLQYIFPQMDVPAFCWPLPVLLTTVNHFLFFIESSVLLILNILALIQHSVKHMLWVQHMNGPIEDSRTTHTFRCFAGPGLGCSALCTIKPWLSKSFLLQAVQSVPCLQTSLQLNT